MLTLLLYQPCANSDEGRAYCLPHQVAGSALTIVAFMATESQKGRGRVCQRRKLTDNLIRSQIRKTHVDLAFAEGHTIVDT